MKLTAEPPIAPDDGPPKNDIITVTVKTLKGHSFTLKVRRSDTVSTLKKMLEAFEKTPPTLQQLKLGRQVLEDKRTLSSYGITEGMTLDFKICVDVQHILR